MPVVFDEVCVVAYSLARGFAHPALLAFEVPIAVSNGITPLWAWLQAIPAAVFGETTRLGLRTLPVLCGLVTVWLSYRLGASIGGPRAAAIAGGLSAVHSPYVFASARGEYSESLFTVLVLLLLGDLHAGGRRPPGRAMVWPAIGLFAYFGKGVLLWAGYVAYLAMAWLLSRVFASSAERGLSARLTALWAALPMLPSLLWLGAAEAVLFRQGQTLATDLGPVHSVWTNVARLTVGYGSSAQQFMVSTWRDALFVYTRFDFWPTMALLAVPGIAALAALSLDAVRAARGRNAAALLQDLAFLCLMTPVAVIVVKGALDVRFHLLYMPVLLVAIGVTGDRALAWLEAGRPWPFLSAAAATWFYVAWTQREADPLTRALWMVLGAVLVLSGGALLLRGTVARRAIATFLLLASLYTVWASATRGPLDWGRRWAWEPSPLPGDTPREVASFPNVDVQLMDCAVTRDSPDLTRSLASRALDRHPQDRDILLAVGPVLIDGGPESSTRVLRAAAEMLRLRPGDAEVKSLLARLSRRRGGDVH